MRLWDAVQTKWAAAVDVPGECLGTRFHQLLISSNLTLHSIVYAKSLLFGFIHDLFTYSSKIRLVNSTDAKANF